MPNTTPASVANGWHQMRTPEGRTTLTPYSAPGSTKPGDRIGADLNGDGTMRIAIWSDSLNAWVMMQFSPTMALEAKVHDQGSLEDAKKALIDALGS